MLESVTANDKKKVIIIIKYISNILLITFDGAKPLQTINNLIEIKGSNNLKVISKHFIFIMDENQKLSWNYLCRWQSLITQNADLQWHNGIPVIWNIFLCIYIFYQISGDISDFLSSLMTVGIKECCKFSDKSRSSEMFDTNDF